jgi:sulfhydrogenase subunit gamma (sulfur reductase)
LDEDLVPRLMRLEDIRQETPDTKSLRLVFEDPHQQRAFAFEPGQFCLLSVFGVGESVFCLASPPFCKDFLEVTVKEVGKVTAAIHDLEVGDRVGFRGPYGHPFPYAAMLGRNVIFVGGGIGLAPLRPLIWQTLAQRDKFGDLYVIYGARSVADLVYKADLREWQKKGDLRLTIAVDPGGEDQDWTGEVGLVPQVLEKAGVPVDSVLVTSGPPIMIKLVLVLARKLGFRPADVVTTLEMKMKCGVGTCGRCNVGNRYVCKDGPVFTLEQLQELPDEF